MIYKIPSNSKDKVEVIYPDPSTHCNKREFSFPMGLVLTELMQIDYEAINAWVDSNFDVFDRHRFNMNDCEYFRDLSEVAKFLLLFCTKLRFIRTRIGTRHALKRDRYFTDVERTISFIKKAVSEGNDNEEYFDFFFKHHLRIYNSDGIYGSDKDLNILNYFFPIALSYSHSFEDSNHTENLYNLLSEAESDKTKVDDIIALVPENTIHREMIDRIHEHLWNAETGRYRIAISRALDDVADIFSDSEDLKLKFIEIIYEYECLQNDRLYTFGRLNEYIGLSALECYRSGFRICRCPECGKYFVRTSNSRRLCGDPTCASQNKKKAAQQRKHEFHIDDQNVFSAVYKSLCYSKIGKAKPTQNPNAYAIEGKISAALSKQIVDKLQTGLIQNYRDDNQRYKKEIRSSSEGQEQKLALYYDWLRRIKGLYSHQYVMNCYANSSLADFRSSEPFHLDYYRIVDWCEIETDKFVVIE